MKAAGYGNVDVDELIAMKVHDVTPEYIQAMRDTGFKPDADQVIGMKAQGVTAEYITSMRSMGFKPDADEIIAMKVHDVTPEYVQQMRSLVQFDGAGPSPACRRRRDPDERQVGKRHASLSVEIFEESGAPSAVWEQSIDGRIPPGEVLPHMITGRSRRR